MTDMELADAENVKNKAHRRPVFIKVEKL
jgi:hypothetical protein